MEMISVWSNEENNIFNLFFIVLHTPHDIKIKTIKIKKNSLSELSICIRAYFKGIKFLKIPKKNLTYSLLRWEVPALFLYRFKLFFMSLSQAITFG